MIAVCTMEKANVAVNNMIQQRRMHELVSVVVDEAHMVADPGRCVTHTHTHTHTHTQSHLAFARLA